MDHLVGYAGTNELEDINPTMNLVKVINNKKKENFNSMLNK
jgi:hypothetical protein